MSNEKVKQLAKDLSKDFPRSPRELVGGYVVAGRTLDKCRAVLAGTQGEYHYDCPLDNTFLGFTGIKADAFKSFVATGATDEEVGKWIGEHSQVKNREEVVAWNNKMRATRPCDISTELQMFLEDYIPKVIPKGRQIYVWFDVYDIEEKRQ